MIAGDINHQRAVNRQGKGQHYGELSTKTPPRFRYPLDHRIGALHC